MHFAAYVIKTGIYIGARSGVMEAMLYNGQKILIFRGDYTSNGRRIVPGNLLEIDGGNQVEVETFQEPNTYHNLWNCWAVQITDEDTIKTFFAGIPAFSVKMGIKYRLWNFKKKIRALFSLSRLKPQE